MTHCALCRTPLRQPYFSCGCDAFLCTLCPLTQPEKHQSHLLKLVFLKARHAQIQGIVVHTGHSCSNCGKQIQGTRYKCYQCVGSNLCSVCYGEGGRHQRHNYIALQRAEQLQVQVQQLEYLEELGSGCFGDVTKVVERASKSTFALKRINLQRVRRNAKALARSFENQFRARAEIVSPAVANLLGFSLDGPYIYVLMEFAGYTTLEQRVKAEVEGQPMCLFQKLGYLTQLASALSCIHRKGFVHKDVKPDNVVISGAQAKLCDMGVVTLVSEQNRIAPILWSAPELLDDARSYDERVDLYSMGLLANYLFTGQLHRRSPDGTLVLPASQYFPNVVMYCLQQDPRMRPSATELLNYLTRFTKQLQQEVRGEGMLESVVVRMQVQQRNDLFEKCYQRVYQKMEEQDQE